MMNLILVFVISVMSRAKAEVRQLSTTLTEGHPFRPLHETITITIAQAQNFLEHLIALRLRNILHRLVLQAICAENLVRRPGTAGIKVVKGEERRCVEVGNMVLL